MSLGDIYETHDDEDYDDEGKLDVEWFPLPSGLQEPDEPQGGGQFSFVESEHPRDEDGNQSPVTKSRDPKPGIRTVREFIKKRWE